MRPIDSELFDDPKAIDIQKKATLTLQTKFNNHTIWGFKSGGVLRLTILGEGYSGYSS